MNIKKELLKNFEVTSIEKQNLIDNKEDLQKLLDHEKEVKGGLLKTVDMLTGPESSFNDDPLVSSSNSIRKMIEKLINETLIMKISIRLVR